MVGVSFHVGSGATNPEAFSAAIALARAAFDAGTGEPSLSYTRQKDAGAVCSGLQVLLKLSGLL